MNTHPANSVFRALQKISTAQRPVFDWSMTAEQRQEWSAACAKWDREHPYRERLSLAGSVNINRLDDNDPSNRVTESQQQSRDDRFDSARDVEGHR